MHACCKITSLWKYLDNFLLVRICHTKSFPSASPSSNSFAFLIPFINNTNNVSGGLMYLKLCNFTHLLDVHTGFGGRSHMAMKSRYQENPL